MEKKQNNRQPSTSQSKDAKQQAAFNKMALLAKAIKEADKKEVKKKENWIMIE
jgi:hypothetical protein